MNIPITLKQLRYLCTLAETGHFGQAADACFVTQSTLSTGIMELEDRLGVTLFERSTKRVFLTENGKRLVDRAQVILTQVGELVEEAAATSEPLTKSIRLGVIPTIAPFTLPPLLAALRKDHPKLKLLIREDLSANISQLLNTGELDLLLLALPYPMENVQIRHLFYDEFYLAYPRKHPLEQQSPLHTAALKGQELLLLEDGHCLRDHELAACRLTDTQVNVPYTATSLHTLVQMVANGIGVTLLPKMAIDSGILKGTQLKTMVFAEKNVSRSIGLAWRKSSPRVAEFEMLAAYIIEHHDKSKN